MRCETAEIFVIVSEPEFFQWEKLSGVSLLYTPTINAVLWEEGGREEKRNFNCMYIREIFVSVRESG